MDFVHHWVQNTIILRLSYLGNELKEPVGAALKISTSFITYIKYALISESAAITAYRMGVDELQFTVQ